MSRFAAWLYAKLRPTNFGVTRLAEKNHVMGAMLWYHRAESGGNSEVALAYQTLIAENFA